MRWKTERAGSLLKMDGKSGRMKRNDPRLGYINRFVDECAPLLKGHAVCLSILCIHALISSILCTCLLRLILAVVGDFFVCECVWGCDRVKTPSSHKLPLEIIP